MLLTSAVQTAVVVDERGRYVAVLTLDTLGDAFRSDEATTRADRAAREAERVP